MYGAILGDILGSIYEGHNRKTEQPEEIDLFHPRCRFTDDTVLTFAVAEAALGDRDYKSHLVRWANRHPHAGYGGGFKQWFRADDPQPYNSFGNGSAMRVSAIGWTCKSLDEVLAEAKRSAEVSHNHPEGIKGAQAVAAAVYLAQINSKEDIKAYIEETFGYDLGRTIDEIRPNYRFDVSCQGSVPEAIIAFLESRDFVHAIQLAISIGGDSDTIACITGAIAEAFYRKIPDEYIRFAHEKLSDEMKPLLHAFCRKYTKADKSAFPEFYAAEKKEKKQKREEEEQRRVENEKHRELVREKERQRQEELRQYYARRSTPIPLEKEIYISLLFAHAPEDIFIRINPLAFGYKKGECDDMPDDMCYIIDNLYSDQSHLQYQYYVDKEQGEAFFSLIVAAFEDDDTGDHRDPNRARFLEYFREPENWGPILRSEDIRGYFKLDFVSPPQPVAEADIPPEKLAGIWHITQYTECVNELRKPQKPPTMWQRIRMFIRRLKEK